MDEKDRLKVGAVVAGAVIGSAIVGGLLLMRVEAPPSPPPPPPPPPTEEVTIDLSVSGETSYPGIIDLNITVTNKSASPREFAIFAVIGSMERGAWYGPEYEGVGYYRDGIPHCPVPKYPDAWWEKAYICTPMLDVNEGYNVTRRIEIPNFSWVTDALVEVFPSDDGTPTALLALEHAPNVITPPGPPPPPPPPPGEVACQIVGDPTYSIAGDGSVTISATVRNTGNVAHNFGLFFGVGSLEKALWYGPGYYVDGLPVCTVQGIPTEWWATAFTCKYLDPGEEAIVTRTIKYPSGETWVTDLIVQVRNSSDFTELATKILTNVIGPEPPPPPPPPPPGLQVTIAPTEVPNKDVGNTVTWTATVTGGDGSPSYQWFLDGSAVIGETSPSYALLITEGMVGAYHQVYCEVTDTTGVATSNTVQFYVNELPGPPPPPGEVACVFVGDPIFSVADGTVTISARIRNTGNVAHSFPLFFGVGSLTQELWYGPGYYTDGLPRCIPEILPVDNEWWRNAFTCQRLEPGAEATVTRKIGGYPPDTWVTDIFVDVRNFFDAREALDARVLHGVLPPQPPPPPPEEIDAEIVNVVVTGQHPGTTVITATIRNTGNRAHKFAVMSVIGEASSEAWYGPLPRYYTDGLPVCTVQEAMNPWVANAFVCKTLQPGEEWVLTRTLNVPAFFNTPDAKVEVREPTYIHTLYDQRVLLNSVPQP